MSFNDYFNEFCKKHGYIGSMGYDKDKQEYNLVISKDTENAGAFFSKEELKELGDKQIQDLLNILHIGFKEKFNK